MTTTLGESSEREVVRVPEEPAVSRDPGTTVDWDEVADAYTAFVEAAPLLSADRGALGAKRGLSDATVDALSFRSGGRSAEKALLSLRDGFSAEILTRSGLFAREPVAGGGDDDCPLVPHRLWLRRGVLVPYLSEDKRVLYLRAHKLGPKGVPLRIYDAATPLNLKPEGPVYLTEGEFKAAALSQLGFRAVAVPGVASFVGRHFDELAGLLKRWRAQEVVIVFDTEDKANPDSPNYKTDVFKRYDTPYFAWRMARQLAEAFRDLAGFKAAIATLPMSWAVDGKVDCDGALACGRTRPNFEDVFKLALRPDAYLRGDASSTHLTEEARRVMTARMSLAF